MSALPYNYEAEYRSMSLLALQNNLFHQRERLAHSKSLVTVKSTAIGSECEDRIKVLESLIEKKIAQAASTAHIDAVHAYATVR